MNDYEPINDPKYKKAMLKIWLIFYVATFAWMYKQLDGEVLFPLLVGIPTSVFFMVTWFVIYEIVIEPIVNWIKK